MEDDPVVFRPTMRSLRQSGYNVLGSCSGEEALEICRRCADKIDLVITDMVMPRISGRELVRRLSALRPELKALFISGYTDEAVLQSGALAPGTPFLQKPFTPAVLARKVREVLDSATSQTYIPVRER
ncbi:MAG: response regulator [Elusimicrobia bacterium]|nr:response regulator [Elusimicrobiota bacterium]